jgi:hypothetical protein
LVYDDDDDDDTTDDDRRILTPEESDERIFNMDLISRQAEKNKKKIDCHQTGTYARPVEEFQQVPGTSCDGTFEFRADNFIYLVMYFCRTTCIYGGSSSAVPTIFRRQGKFCLAPPGR